VRCPRVAAVELTHKARWSPVTLNINQWLPVVAALTLTAGGCRSRDVHLGGVGSVHLERGRARPSGRMDPETRPSEETRIYPIPRLQPRCQPGRRCPLPE